MSKVPRIYISATGQNAGKTTFSIGLIAALLKRFKNIGFIKPIGQRYLMEQGFKVDEDSILIQNIFNISGGISIKDLSPVAVERGFTEKYIEGSANGNYVREIRESFERVSYGKDLVIIEGTGHAGVGSVFDLSNATVAKLLKSKVILLTPGGVGRPIDEAMLNRALFYKEGVELAGVVVNKLLPQKFDKINKYVRIGFERKKMKVLGTMPYQKRLALPTMREIYEELELELLCGEHGMENTVDKILIGAMEIKDAVKYVIDNSLMITPSDRLDMIKAMVDIQMGRMRNKKFKIAGLILTGSAKPQPKIIALLKKSGIPVLLSDCDTYSCVSDVHNMKVKIKPEDKNKIEIIIKMVQRYVNIDKIMEAIVSKKHKWWGGRI